MSSSAIATQLKSCPIFIDGKARLSRGEVLIQHNPATGEPVAEIPLCTSDEVSAAIASAQAAFPAWSATPVLNRCRVLFHLHTLMEKHADDLMLLIVEENGKTREEARGSFQRGLECVEFASGVSSLMMGETVEHVGTDVDGWSTRHALGVCVGITPFNFPLMVPLWMFPVAIACGNTFVLKPSERVPRSSVRLLELIYEAGLPAGVMNLVHGTKQVVDQLLTDPRVKAVSFVGSSPVAKYIYTTAAANGKRVQALGGAKNHSVVMPDADMKHSANTIMSSSFGCAGERCVATSVVVAVGDAADPLLSALKKAADEMKVGDGSEHGTVMGPIINSEAKKRILNYIDVGQQEGAKLARDGRNDTCCDSEGYFVGPTIFDNVKPSMRIAREEIFGPVLSLVRAKDLGEAIDIVNGSEYGNASS
ncbi:MAG: CoA-acylating methylmalonate-semialdehyde dehydrogenase, partial [Acidobacteria bacterium]|nr:CoA-acylating methylmalonate-semialdehyde dehydrogenase [Acidobacteriota bacterium]